MYSREVPWGVAPSSVSGVRHLVAAVLRSVSRSLAMSARKLSAKPRRLGLPPQLEFYAEAGAPEGALYVNGQLVGRMSGVSRL